MIDLHCHILPGLDDGPRDLDSSLAMAEVAVADGIETIVATPHIRADYAFPHAEIPARASTLNEALHDAGLALEVLTGGELALSEAGELDDEALRRICLGGGRYLLVESPYTEATDLLEQNLFQLQLRGFGVVLAHPERSPSFQQDPGRLAGLVQRGVLCSLTAASVSGRFGATVQRFSRKLLKSGLVHDIATDAHDAVRRRPRLSSAFGDDVGHGARAAWLTRDAPRAIIAGEELPPAPPAEASRRRLRSLFGGHR